MNPDPQLRLCCPCGAHGLYRRGRRPAICMHEAMQIAEQEPTK